MAFSTQQSVPIAGIKDGIVILKNGGYRMILEISAINFSLKSEEEQNSLVFQYQSFLNSLHFPIEVVIRSKRLDLSPYLTKVQKASEKSINELIRTQIEDYVDFVGKLISIANIMKKSFYVVIPFDPINVKKLNILDSLFSKAKSFDHLKISDAEFKTMTGQITERANTIASGLGQMGLHCIQLSTEEIIELFYQIYNPDEAGKERVTDAGALDSPVVISQGEVNVAGVKPPTEKEEFARAIDNTAIVEQQQKQAGSERRQAAQKEGEKQASVPAPSEAPKNNTVQATAIPTQAIDAKTPPTVVQPPVNTNPPAGEAGQNTNGQ